MMEKQMETTIVYWGYIGMMEKNMETTIMGLYRDYGGQRCRLQELRMETTKMGSIGII